MQDTDSPLRISRPLASDTPQIYPVTVVATEVGNKYNINDELQPILILEEGVTYRFDQSDTTNKGHPLRLSATEDGIHNGGSEYSVHTNVVGVAGEEGFFTQVTVAQGSAICFITAYFTVVCAVDLTLLSHRPTIPLMPQVLKLVMIHFLESPFLEVLAMTSSLADRAMTQ